MTLSKDVQKLLNQRYLQPNEDWNGLVKRVVDHVCAGENVWYKQEVTEHLTRRIWLPNSPCLVNSGTKTGGLFACFVVGPDEDNLENHVEVLGDIASVGKRGGGCGFTGTHIRPEGSAVAGSAHGYAYGPNNWALRVSDYLDMITQGGFRKMALMYTLRSDHQDLDKFIDLKRDKDEKFAYNFNQSVMATDEWMEQATSGDNGERLQLVKIAKNAWSNGDPGLLFHTTINTNTPYKTCGCEIEATNPCGEQPIPAYGSCNLGSINISHEYFYDDKGNFDYARLARVVMVITRFLDNVGSKNIFPNDKFKSWYEDHRPIGIGIMGYADSLLKLKMRYGDDKSLEFLSTVMETIQKVSYSTSEQLGKERGVPAHCAAVGRRNITTVSIAPTGSIGFISECSHGIEPIFSPVYQRTDERGETYLFSHSLRNEPYFVSCLNDDESKVPTWKQHVDVQATVQQHCDSAVSKTINMPNGARVQDVLDAFVYAWRSGCKGITVYRDGSRQFQVLEDVKEEDSLLQDCPSGVCEL
jgi:ribonucleoside-diphosphate reductase alpha chain